MKVISVNVGMPRVVEFRGEPVATGIFKEPVRGAVKVNELNLEGDGQADLRVHGGLYKAVYVYPSEHYEYWRQQLPGVDLPWGAFGENLTIDGLVESDVRPGDRLRIGSSEFAVTQPRYPCYKLGIKFGRSDMVRRFAKSGLTGFYLSVLKTGEVESGDYIEFVQGPDRGDTIKEIAAERLNFR
ncbi:MAG TPA: MOSC domain-containing protein [Pyrinomonadaceae bacterium]|nr:MOSC domain-containing protein [Pyrinomonadaceae bacterium]